MAFTISKLKMWKDPGYTRNCPEMPPLGSWKLPSVPDYATTADETLRPHKDSTLTRLNLPLSFTTVFGMSYLYIEASDGAGSVKLFGWITSIEQRSTSAEGVTIAWDVDWWRTYSGSATLGAGQVVKCSNTTYKRPYRSQPRYWQNYAIYEIHKGAGTVPIYNTSWIYINTVYTSSADQVTKIATFFAPMNTTFVSGANGVGTDNVGPSFEYVFSGYLDEFMAAIGGLSVNIKIIGVWTAPVAPDDFAWEGTNQKWYNSSAIAYTTYTKDGYSLMINHDNVPLEASIDYTISSIGTTDTERVILADHDGNILGTLPYGTTCTGVKGTLDIGTNGGYLNLMLKSSIVDPGNTFTDAQDLKLAPSVGCGFSIPLPSIPVNENQWSDYVQSGQRDFDVTSARIANEQKAISGIESTISAGIGGGVTGASAGPLGAIVGVVAGAGLQGIMTGVNYGLGENFNQQLQEAKDKLYASQKNGIILTGNSLMKIMYEKCLYPLLIHQKCDTTSAAEYTADITINGYDTDVPVANVGTFITGVTGPLRILNLTITGSIPPQAKQYIKDKFEQGIRITENNPTGVAP